MLHPAEGNDFAAILDGSSLGTAEALVTQEAGIRALKDSDGESPTSSGFNCLADVETVTTERAAAEKASTEGRYQAAFVWLHSSQFKELDQDWSDLPSNELLSSPASSAKLRQEFGEHLESVSARTATLLAINVQLGQCDENDEQLGQCDVHEQLGQCDGYIALAVDPQTGEVDAHGPYDGLSATLKADRLRHAFDEAGLTDVSVGVVRLHTSH